MPDKVLKEINGVPLLEYQVNRVRQSKLIDSVIVATSDNRLDDAIVEFCEQTKINCFRGSENNVLERYYECAKQYNADIVVRLTGDCPFSDPSVIDATVGLLEKSNADFSANTVPPEKSCFPDGSDVEVFSMCALERAHAECLDPHDREHVTFYFWKYDNGFKTVQLGNEIDYSKYRLTVDYPEDLEVVSFIMGELEQENMPGSLDEIIEILKSNPSIMELNAHHYFGEGWVK